MKNDKIKTVLKPEINKMEVIKEEKEHNIDLVMKLTQEIGEFGLYQFRVIAMAAVVLMFVGWSTNQFLFTAARINTRCFIKYCDVLGETVFAPSWMENAIPVNSQTFDDCHMFLKVNDSVKDNCPAEIFDNSTIVPCDTYIYENTNTIVYDFDLACDEWRRTLIGTLRTIAILIDLPISGYISDRWGRRSALVFYIMISAFVGTIRIFTQTYVGFVISQFFDAFGFGAFLCGYIMSMEIVGIKYRAAAAASMNTSFSIGQITLAAIAWVLPNWKQLTLALYIPQFIVISYIWLMPENHRWYMSKGRYADAEKMLKNAARTNKKQISDASLTALKKAAEESVNEMQNSQKVKEPMLIILVFKYKVILLICVVTGFWYMSNLSIYYGLSINAVHLSGNIYLNYMLVAAVEIPGYWLAVFLTHRIRKRVVLIGGFWICAFCMLSSIFVSVDAHHELALALYMIGKFSICVVLVTTNLYTIEAYPTKYRHSLVAFSTAMGRFGQLIAPLMPAFSAEIWVHLPFALFASLAFISGVLALLIPEGASGEMPDTMEQAANIGK